MLAFDPVAPALTPLAIESGGARVRAVAAAADVAYLHVELELSRAPVAGTTLWLGLDTYADDLGESRFGDGTRSPRRIELALELRLGEGPDAAQLCVTRAYDLYGNTHGALREGAVMLSTTTDGSVWDPVQWNPAQPTPATRRLPFSRRGLRHGDAACGARRPRDQPLVLDGARVRLRLPWTLL